jgi:hypothetical protein
VLDVAFGDDLRRSVVPFLSSSSTTPTFTHSFIVHRPAGVYRRSLHITRLLSRQRVNVESALPVEVLSSPAFLSSLVVQ